MNDRIVDPFDEASNIQMPAMEIYGQVSIDAWHCVLKKGEGKRPFQEGIDDLLERKTAVDMIILPIDEMKSKFQQERYLVAQSLAWAKITWPSLQRLGLANAKEVQNRWCRAKLTQTGRKWTNKNGEQSEETTFEFLELYAGKEECVSAYAGRRGGEVKAAALNTDSPEKNNAYKFAVAIVKNVATETKDFIQLTQKVKDKIAAMPVVSKHFTIDSPEIMALIAEAL